jgi:hypothetical protein
VIVGFLKRIWLFKIRRAWRAEYGPNFSSGHAFVNKVELLGVLGRTAWKYGHASRQKRQEPGTCLSKTSLGMINHGHSVYQP